MARKEKEQDSENPGRMKQIGLTYKMAKRVDRWIGLWLILVFLVTFGIILGIGILWGHPIYLGILGFLVALLTTAIVFGRRAERAAYSQMEGQPGAAAAALENMRRGIVFTPAVAVNRQQDVVHRAVGKCGVVLVGEGNPNRLKTLMAAEKRRMNRVVSDVPVHDIVVGKGEGQVELKNLRRTIAKFRKELPGPRVTEVNDRLRAMGDLLSNMPIPKGPMPKGGGGRMKGMNQAPRRGR
ncbi:DUF4191 domain-containing protein [Streptomyces sp. DSM 44915]|uniref:DUF4191 domain-containing protein n=1 Tax=Streptomyces chisholmiae TaxID=3075540 RepID=A0ABU2JJF3_9ACTN|nr:DUF4191 domain-containing protein [Streptomyces sp. DSM 44915]MDT0264891.1 DUF4191 domain-containing protein [Streptomyces sp. DSM 44915]